MKYYKARGIVLHTVKYGDNALIAYLYTDSGGRVNYMIRGVHSQRKKSNKAALFQPMFVLEFEGLEQSRTPLHQMKEVRNLIPLATLPFDVRKSTIALFMAEVLYRLIREEESNPRLFDFICRSVEYLDRTSEGISNFHLWFLVRLSAYLGFYPGNNYAEENFFDIQRGLFCPAAPLHSLCMDKSPARLLGRLMVCGADELAELKLSRGQRSEFMEAMLAFFGYHFDAIHTVESVKILREVF